MLDPTEIRPRAESDSVRYECKADRSAPSPSLKKRRNASEVIGHRNVILRVRAGWCVVAQRVRHDPFRVLQKYPSSGITPQPLPQPDPEPVLERGHHAHFGLWITILARRRPVDSRQQTLHAPPLAPGRRI